MAVSPSNIALLDIDAIVHPSDFSQASGVAFAHALKLGIATRAKLDIMHVALEDEDVDWPDFPGVRSTLERWGLLQPGSARSEVEKTGVRVAKYLAPAKDPIQSTIDYLQQQEADLVVLATHRREGLSRWTNPSVAEPIARRAETMTLFVPQGVDGFISAADSAVSLQSILVPIDTDPNPQVAVDVAAQLALTLEVPDAKFTLLHIGSDSGVPAVRETARPGWTWERVVREGPVVQEVLDMASVCTADVIVLATAGHHGFMDALRGSTSERILRGATCPVLAIPAN